MSYETVFEQYRRGIAPKKAEWSLCDSDGWTIAHTAASENRLPASFGEWDLVDNEGTSVAHVYAVDHVFPACFTYWGLVDGYGETVAHIAANHGKLPEHFENWGLKNKRGQTVGHYAVLSNHTPYEFKHWGLCDVAGDTVAHLAASLDRLPKAWQIKDIFVMKNDAGVSVGDLLAARQLEKKVVEKARLKQIGDEVLREAREVLKNPIRGQR